ncbi:uncharacterized protein CTRU02_204995 [Colletotrichum truncatum]|uniref:Uncharacterized protein n=1 Tax=Colletotrichum truncatum TaxID=5467 RepID=A0ACC3Z326_COLTU|nr:uncharacterized protein CTRU02_06176 [Colletotrichum truncatum]KAF6793304.1 hypothetical protein CTRU02_06176 [Colletotrichum truncatum]
MNGATDKIATRLLAWLILIITPVSSTFLQWQLCDDSRGSGAIPFGMSASLISSSDSASSQLVLGLARHQSGITCRDTQGAISDDEALAVTVKLDWIGLRQPKTFKKDRMRLECKDFTENNRPAFLPNNSSRVEITLLDDDIGVLPALSTLRAEA